MNWIELDKTDIDILLRAYSPTKVHYKEWVFAGAFHTGIYDGMHINVSTAIEDLKHFYKGVASGFDPPGKWLEGVNAIYKYLYDKTGLRILNEYWIFDGMMEPRKEILTSFHSRGTVIFSTLERKITSVYHSKDDALRVFKY